MGIECDRMLPFVGDPFYDFVYRVHIYRISDLGDNYGFVKILIRSR